MVRCLLSPLVIVWITEGSQPANKYFLNISKSKATEIIRIDLWESIDLELSMVNYFFKYLITYHFKVSNWVFPNHNSKVHRQDQTFKASTKVPPPLPHFKIEG